jgi:putative oxidoreductase
MSEIISPRAGAAAVVLSLLRFVAGLCFMQHGLSKLFAFPAASPAHMTALVFAAGIIEALGGLLVCIGLLTRPAAFIMSGEMAIGYFMVHLPKSIFPIVNGGDLAIMYCFVFFYIAVAGGGAWSLDRLMSGRRSWLAGPQAA